MRVFCICLQIFFPIDSQIEMGYIHTHRGWALLKKLELSREKIMGIFEEEWAKLDFQVRWQIRSCFCVMQWWTRVGIRKVRLRSKREQERKKGCLTELLRNRRAIQGKEESQEKRVPALWLPGQEGKQKPLPKGKPGWMNQNPTHRVSPQLMQPSNAAVGSDETMAALAGWGISERSSRPPFPMPWRTIAGCHLESKTKIWNHDINQVEW